LGNDKWMRAGCIAGALFMAALLLVGAHDIGKVNNVPHWFHKVEHFFYYGVMALLLAHGLGRRWFWLALFFVPLVGALDEWHQIYVPRRSASAWDWATDALAAAVAVYLYHRWTTGERSDLVRGKS
jgi:VanZ family protein